MIPVSHPGRVSPSEPALRDSIAEPERIAVFDKEADHAVP